MSFGCCVNLTLNFLFAGANIQDLKILRNFIGNIVDMAACGKKIEDAGLTWTRLPKFNPKFDQADLYMDMRSAVCRAQFDLEDWI